MERSSMLGLQTLCMEVVVERLEELTSLCPKSRRLLFKSTPGLSLHYLAEPLLQVLQRKGQLNDTTLSLFYNADGCVTSCLNRVSLCGRAPPLTLPSQWSMNLTNRGLQVLASHSLTELELTDIRGVRVDLVLKQLKTATRQNLTSLKVARIDVGSVTASVVCRFPKLRVLEMVGVGFSTDDVVVLARAEMKMLECLDLSSNANITDITSLSVYSKQLRSLCLRDCLLEWKVAVPTLTGMRELRCLDVLLQSPRHASFAEQHTWFCYVGRLDHITRLRGECVLELVDSMPHLEFLDVSGRGVVPEALLRRFMGSHPNLRCLGLMNCEVCLSPLFNDRPRDREARRPLRVYGDCTEEQVLQSLRHYVPLDLFTQEVLRSLRPFCARTLFREEAVKLILQSLPGKQGSQCLETFHEAVLCLNDLLPLHSDPLTLLDPALVKVAVHLVEHTWRPFRKTLHKQLSCESVKQSALGEAVKLFIQMCGYSHLLPT